MSEIEERGAEDVAPGFMDAPGHGLREGLLTYSIGFVLAVLLTAASFYLVRTTFIWGPGIIMALVALAIAQIGVHLVFFLHLTTAPDNTNNALALAFGVLIVTLVVGGSLWIMSHLAHNVMPDRMMARMDLDGVAAESALRVDGVVAPMEPQPIEAGVAGRVASVHCDAGMHVEAGRLCAEIDPRPYRAAVAQRSGETRTAEARLEALRATLDRTRAALQRAEARGAGGRTIGRLRRSVERQQAGVEREEADVTRLRTARAAAESALAQTRIVVPVEGRIRSRDIEPGREVSAKAPLFVVAPDQARVTAALDTAQSGRIAVGDKAIFTVDALPGQAFYGKVTKIAPARNGEAATMDMTASDPRRMLKPGMAATARIFAR